MNIIPLKSVPVDSSASPPFTPFSPPPGSTSTRFFTLLKYQIAIVYINRKIVFYEVISEWCVECIAWPIGYAAKNSLN